MEKEDIEKFKEELKEITFSNLKDEEFMGALTDLFVLIGDIFSLVKVPKADYIQYTKMRRTRNYTTQIRELCEDEKK